jgi:hypothetical protein
VWQLLLLTVTVSLLPTVIVKLLLLVTVMPLLKDALVVVAAAAAVAVAEQAELAVEGVLSEIRNASAIALSCGTVETPVVTEKNFQTLFSGVASLLSAWTR